MGFKHFELSRYGSLVALILFVVILFSNFQISIVDDAYIFERYASNLAQHGQLVFNLGEKVEGITSLLWTLILFVNERFIHISLEKYIAALSLLILIVLSIRIWYFCSWFQKPWLGFAIPLLLLTQKDFLISSTNGLEGVLYGYLLFEMLYSFWEGKAQISFILGGMIFLTRPESFVFAPIMLILFTLMEEKKRNLLWKFSLFLVMVFGVSVFRWAYYGEIIPNSVIAKLIPLDYLKDYGLSSAFKYIIGFMRNNVFFIFILFFTLIYLWEIAKLAISDKPGTLFQNVKDSFILDSDNRTILLAVIIIFYSFIVTIRNGGDWMSGYRLLSQYLPAYTLVLLLLIKKNEINGKLLASFGIVTGILFFSGSSTLRIGFPFVKYGSVYYEDIARRIESSLREDDLISAEGIGYISHLLPNQPIFDPLGLTDKYIARNGWPALTYGKTDIKYLLQEVKPAIVIWHWGGHLYGYEELAQEKYIVFCGNDCDNLDADLVLIRKDVVQRFQKAFIDWTEIDSLAKIFK